MFVHRGFHSAAFAAVLCHAALVGVALGQIEVKPKHPASQLDGLRFIEFADDEVRLEVDQPNDGLLVLQAKEPLLVEQVTGGKAKLRLGWDGTIGYSHYWLEISPAAAGPMTVQLRRIMPPEQPQPTDDVDLAAFEQKLKHRASRPPEDAEQFREWQQRYRHNLAAALMGGSLPQRVPLEAREIETKDFPTFTLRRVEYRSRTDRKNVLLLSLPKNNKSEKAPLLLGIHGHEAPWGKADEAAYRMGHRDDFIAYFAERNWAVLQPATMNHTLGHADWTLQGEWTWDAMVALDYATTIAEVDMDRIAVCGLSTGAHLSMNVLALDTRVKAGVVGCILSTWNHYERRFRIPPHCDCGIRSQMGGLLEQCDWAALAAPKPVMFQHGIRDASFCPGADEELLNLKWNTGILPRAEYDAMFAEIERAWRLAAPKETEPQVQSHIHDGAHKVDNEAAFAWLTRWVADLK